MIKEGSSTPQDISQKPPVGCAEHELLGIMGMACQYVTGDSRLQGRTQTSPWELSRFFVYYAEYVMAAETETYQIRGSGSVVE